MKIELVPEDLIAYESVEPKELAEGVYLTADGSIFIIGSNGVDTLKISR